MTIPDRIARLEKDVRGYPIPWNVLRGDDGFPHFTVTDDRKAWRAIRESLCPICGERLGRWRWLVGGPRSAFDPNGYYIDLPVHRDCGEFALATCPYLAAPKYLGRLDVVHPEHLPVAAKVVIDETMLPDRPEVFVAVMSDRIELVDRAPLTPYHKPAELFEWRYWRHGREINETQALPFLRRALGKSWQPPKAAV
jgi:hypothetical protein